MDLAHLLFNPNGRSGQRDFLRGAILLTGFWIVAQVLITYGGAAIGMMAGLLTWASVYCYLCVYGKRLHDSGRSAWLFLVFLIGYMIISALTMEIGVRLFAPGALEVRSEMEYLMQREGMVKAVMTHGPAYNKMTLVPQMLSLLISNAVLAYVAAKLKSDPQANQHGEPTGTGDLAL